MKLFRGDGDDNHSATKEQTRYSKSERDAAPDHDKAGPQEQPSEKGSVKSLIMRLAIMAVFLFIVLFGLMVIFYPQISEYVNEKNQSRVIESYGEALASLPQADYSAQLQAARAYNSKLAGEDYSLPDAFTNGKKDVNKEDIYWSLLDISDNGIMGYVSIKKLDLRLPIYHGTSEVVLSIGAGHIQGSSLPVGGESTHAVISAHTGLPSAKLFTGLDQMENGDTFTIYVLNEVLTYRVDQVLTVLPHEVTELAIHRGEDFVTLVTCTPYGINSHRLLVRATRIENPPEVVEEIRSTIVVKQEVSQSWFQRVISQITVFLSLIFEKIATALVHATEWVMDIFGIEH